MAKRIVRHGQRARAAVRALEDACEPIEEAHAVGKEALWAAQEAFRAVAERVSDPDDPTVIAAWRTLQEVKAAKTVAANNLEDTRTWLRREAEIVKLQTRTIPRLEEILAGPMLVKHGADDAREDPQARAVVEGALAAARTEMEELTAAAAPLRQALKKLGAVVVGDPVPPDLPPGSADVTTPSITVKPRARRATTDGGL